MSARKTAGSGFVDPMEVRKRLQQQTGTTQPLELVAEVPQTAVAATQATEPEELPWHKAHPKLKIHFGLRLPEPLHKKFEYAANHTLGESMQSFALKALEEAVDRRLKELGVR